MPELLVRVLVQCAEPGVTPDVDNAAVTLPRRMLCELPRELAPLVAASGVTQTVTGPGTQAELALQAAHRVLGADSRFDLLPEPYTHREVAGSYLRSNGDSTVFVLANRGTQRPWTVRQSAIVSEGPDGSGATKELRYEFRCHLLVTRLGAGDADAAAAGEVSDS